jgi:hypothetical protein
MRILLILPAALGLGAAPPPPEPPATAARPWSMPAFGAEPAGCPDTPMSLARKERKKPLLRRLDELPDAQAFAAVDRRSDGCPAPMSLNEARRAR